VAAATRARVDAPSFFRFYQPLLFRFPASAEKQKSTQRHKQARCQCMDAAGNLGLAAELPERDA
jgi:hypothetical protein